MKATLLLALAGAFSLVVPHSARAWLSYLDGASLPQTNGWRIEATDTGTIASLNATNSGIRQRDDTPNGYDQWYLVNTNQVSTLAARFRIESYLGGPANLLQLTAAHSATNPSPALAVGIRDGRFYLLRFIADNTGAPPEDARLADLGPFEENVFNEAWLYIDNITKRARLFWNGALRYTGVETNEAFLLDTGEGRAEFGASTSMPELDRSAIITVTFDWVGFGGAADLPLALPFIPWAAHLDGSVTPTSPWQLFQDTSGTGAGTTEVTEFIDSFNGATNQALRLNSGSGANEWYVGAFMEDEVLGGARFALRDFTPTGRENLLCVTTRSQPRAPAPSITLVDGRYKLWTYVETNAEIIDIAAAVTNEFHTVYLYAHKNGRVRLWWDGNLIFDGPAPLANPYDGYFEWGSGSWQFDATDTIDFDWVAYGALTSPPALTTTPDNFAAFANPASGFTFSLASEAGVAFNGVLMLVNGVDCTRDVTITGTDNLRQGSFSNLVANQLYRISLVFTQLDAGVSTNLVTFDTFSQSNFMFEAEDWNFGGGGFFDQPVLSSGLAPRSYWGQTGVEDVDHNELSTDFAASQHVYRDFDYVGTEPAGDFLRQKYVDAQAVNPAITDHNVGWIEISEWLNYTRTFPTGTFNIYGRFANGNIGQTFTASMDKVTGATTTSQTTTPLGIFSSGPGRGWQSYDFVPLTDAQGNRVGVDLSAVETLRVTSTAGGYNANFYMLVPAPGPRLQVGRAAGNVIVTWSGAGYTLQSASNLTGPWTPLIAQNNTHTLTPGTTPQFFRLSR